MRPEYSIFSDKGGRPVNEDYADVGFRHNAACFVLCDGLGGHGMGDKASRFVARFVLKYFSACKTADEFAADVIPRAHSALCAEQKRLGAVGRMKTTAVILVLEENRAICLHIGDSRLYRFRRYSVDFQTRDHSIPQMLVLTGEINPDEIRSHPDRNKLLRALGDDREEIKYEMSRLEVCPGDAFLLCSDGFWEPVTEQEMLAVLRSEPDAKGWLGRMTSLAFRNSEGKSMDNCTAVAVRIR